MFLLEKVIDLMICRAVANSYIFSLFQVALCVMQTLLLLYLCIRYCATGGCEAVIVFSFRKLANTKHSYFFRMEFQNIHLFICIAPFLIPSACPSDEMEPFYTEINKYVAKFLGSMRIPITHIHVNRLVVELAHKKKINFKQKFT